MKKFSIIQAVGTIVCTTIAIVLFGLFSDSTMAFVIGSILGSGTLSFIFTLGHIFGYDTATLNLKTGGFKTDTDFKTRKGRFLLFTEVEPMDMPEEKEN